MYYLSGLMIYQSITIISSMIIIKIMTISGYFLPEVKMSMSVIKKNSLFIFTINLVLVIF
ncbi:TPA: hypothetical protein I7721_05855 [Vibrio vulnificus]|nr:hypothetical protein [Vibrio vulnificus]